MLPRWTTATCAAGARGAASTGVARRCPRKTRSTATRAIATAEIRIHKRLRISGNHLLKIWLRRRLRCPGENPAELPVQARLGSAESAPGGIPERISGRRAGDVLRAAEKRRRVRGGAGGRDPGSRPNRAGSAACAGGEQEPALRGPAGERGPLRGGD